MYCGDKTVYDTGAHGQGDEEPMSVSRKHMGRMTRSPYVKLTPRAHGQDDHESTCMIKFIPRTHMGTDPPQRGTAPEEREE